MSFGDFICQNDIKVQQKQPLIVLCQKLRQKKKTKKDLIKSTWLLQLTTSFKIFSGKINLCKREKDEKLLLCVCFGFCSKIYAIFRSESQN